MDANWHVVLRDIMIIIATLALLATSVMGALVAWQLYRLAKELRGEIEPVIAAIRETVDTVRDTTEFIGGKVVAPTASVVGAAAGARGIVSLIHQVAEGVSKARK